MLKGHTKIELTDVNTGEITVHEDTNMFTNAIYKTLNNTWTALVGGVSTLKDWHLPLSQKMLGGIALFEDSIEENETINHFPKENKVVGMSGTIASDGFKNWWGSRNLLESQAFDSETHSVKHVWDFSTAEANGTISAVGLTDGGQADYYGQSAWNKRFDRGLNVTSYFSEYGKCIAEFKGDTFVAMTNGTGQVTIKKVKFNFDTVSLNNNLGTTEVISEKTVQLPNSGMNYAYASWFDGDDGYWYGFMQCTNSNCTTPASTSDSSGSVTSSLYLQIIRINKETYGVEYHNISTPTNVYTCPRVGHPIITKNYIVMPYNTSSTTGTNWQSTTYVKYFSMDKVCCINKLDWTCVVKELKDFEGNLYSMYWDGKATEYNACFLQGTWSNLKLKNGLYQMNDIIFDDNVVVQEQSKPYINYNTKVPVTLTDTTSDGYIKCNLIPACSSVSGGKGSCLFMLPNEEKEIILIGGFFNSNGFGISGTTGFVVWAVPYDSQKLMTINNLSEPVTKTASQTMKITYTITDVIEE